MDRERKKGKGGNIQRIPSGYSDNRYVISLEDTRAYERKIVAVAGFPAYGRYAKVIAQADTVEELKQHLQILGILAKSEMDTVSVCVLSGLGVACYVSISKRKPQIKRKGGDV